jgi:hypothetical protein
LGTGPRTHSQRSQHHLYQRIPVGLPDGRPRGNHPNQFRLLREELHQLGPSGGEDQGRRTGAPLRHGQIRLRGIRLNITAFECKRLYFQACDVLLSDPETKDLLYSQQNFDLLVLDGAYPECALGFVSHYNVPFMYINTVGFYTGSLSLAGNPAPYSVTPFLARPFTDSMSLMQRTMNTLWHIFANTLHSFMVKNLVQPVVRKHFGYDVPLVYDISRNVSFILQNAHATVTYPRPYLPNVAEIACIHCKKAKALPDVSKCPALSVPLVL